MAPESVRVPEPDCVTVPEPEMAFDTAVGVPERSNTRLALSVTAPVPREPPVEPFPTCNIPEVIAVVP